MMNLPIRDLMVAAIVAVAGLIAADVDPAAAQTPSLIMMATSFDDGGILPAKFAEPIALSPELRWMHVPAGTRSFVLLVHDPESALNNGTADITHWLLWNIPGSASGLIEGMPPSPQLADGTRQVSIQSNGYMAPAAPPGAYHHYTFELYALDTMLDVPAAAPSAATETRGAVLRAMEGHILGRATLVARFHQ
jgi:Raf kinase inhibitor-like YbhB/YbcL family protein